MAANREKIVQQLDLKINALEGDKTMKGLAKMAALLNRQLDLMDDGTEQYIARNKQLGEVQAKIEKLARQKKRLANEAKFAADSITAMEHEAEELNLQLKRMSKTDPGLKEKAKQFQDLQEEIRKANEEISGTGNQVDKTSGGISRFGTALGPIGGLVAGAFAVEKVVAFAVEIHNVAKNMISARREISRMAQVGGEDLDRMTVQITSLADLFGEDYKEVLRSTNALAKQMGISHDSAFKLIEQGFLAGANANGDFLDKVNEYPQFFRKAGYSAQDFVKIATQEVRGGVFGDKLLDAVKELGLRINELSGSQMDALKKAFGDTFAQDFKNKVDSGALTVKEALKVIENQAQKTGLSVTDMATLTADLGGGPVEDLNGLGEAFKQLNAAQKINLDTLDSYGKAQKAQLEAQKELKSVQQEIAKQYEKTAAQTDVLKTKFKTLAFKGVLEIMKAFQKFKAKVTPIFKRVQKAINGIIDQFGGWKQVSKDVFEAVMERVRPIQKFFLKLGSFIATAVEKFSKMKGVIRVVGAAIKTNFRVGSKIIKTFWNIATDILDVFMGIISLDFSKVWDSIKQGAKNLWSNIKGTIGVIREGIGDAFNTEASQKRADARRLKQMEEAAAKAKAQRKKEEEEFHKESRRKAQEIAKQIEEEERLKKEKSEQAAKAALERQKALWKKLQAQRKAYLARQAQLQKEIEDIELNFIQNKFDREQAALDLEFERKLKKIKGNSERELKLKSDLEQLWDQKKAEIEERRAEEQRAKEEELAQKRLDDFDAKIERMAEEDAIAAEFLEQQFLQKYTTEQERDDALYLLRKTGFDKRISLLRDKSKEEIALIKKTQKELEKLQNKANTEANKKQIKHLQERLAKLTSAHKKTELAVVQTENEKLKTEQEHGLKKVEFDEKVEDAKAQLRRAGYENARDMMGLLVSLLGESEEAKKAALLAEAAFAIGDIIMKTQKEIASYYASMAVLGPVGMGVASGMAVKAKIRAGIGIAAITSKVIQKFEQGGFLGARPGRKEAAFVAQGSSHAKGGIRLFDVGRDAFLPQEIEGDEMVLSRRTVLENPELMSYVNASVNNGGILPEKTQPTRFADGGSLGPVSDLSELGSNRVDEDLKALIVSTKATIDKLNEKVDNMHAKLYYEDLDEYYDERERINEEDQID